MADQFVVVVQGTIYRDGRYLLHTRSEAEDLYPGALSLVGGSVDMPAAEQLPQDANTLHILEDTLRREFVEEVGATIGELTYVHSKLFVSPDGVANVCMVYLCEHVSGEPYAADPDEVAEVHWMRTDEILNGANIPEWTRESIRLCEAVRKNSNHH